MGGDDSAERSRTPPRERGRSRRPSSSTSCAVRRCCPAIPGLVDLEGRRLTTPDVWFDDVALAVMVHSREFHAGVLDGEATVLGDDDLESAGAVVP
jgi:hypothetical protein